MQLSSHVLYRSLSTLILLLSASCADLNHIRPGPEGSEADAGGSGITGDYSEAEDSGFPFALAPGIDNCRGFAWEPTIAVDPNNPMTLAIAQGSRLEFSIDGGNLFLPVVTVPAPSPALNGGNPWCLGGDPAMAFDSQGRLFISYLARPSDVGSCPPAGNIGVTGREVLVTGYEFDGAVFSPIAGVTWPVRATNGAGLAPPANADKNWLAADATPGSPFQDQIYVIWADLSAGEWETRITTATAGGNWNDWSPAFQLTSTDDDGGGDADGLPDDGVRPWPPHVAVAPNGDVYASTHFQMNFLDGGNRAPDGMSGGIMFWRSTNGGAMFGAPTFPFPQSFADMTWNVQSLAGAIPGTTFWLQGSVQGWILPDPNVAGRVHVVTNGDPNDDPTTLDAADVVIATSNDSGANWNAPVKVDNGPAGTFQVMPTAAIDPITGAIGVTYYDNRSGNTNGNGNFLLDLMATYSTDGGANWFPDFVVNDFQFNPDNTTNTRFCGANDTQCPGCVGPNCPVTFRIGEYNGVSYWECTAYMVWADNPICGGGGTDVLFDSDPEMGGDLTNPVPTCPADTAIDCSASTAPSNTGFATTLDNCDLDPSLNFFDVTSPGNCDMGGNEVESIARTWTTVDAAGNADNCGQTISVTDTTAPNLFVPDPLGLECNGPGGVAGDDPQIVNWLNLASALDDCSDFDIENDAPALFPSACGAGQATVVNFTATDACSNVSMDSSSVTVTDTTPPEVTCEVDTDSLWPPNHQFVDIGFEFEASDLCDTNPLDIEITVTSDEDPALELGSGDGIHCADAIVQDDDSVLLRAERAGTGDGRVYSVTIAATDNCGNVASCSVPVNVPIDQSKKTVTVDSGQAFDATVCN
ncbi:MAG: hypothetical protein KJO85_01195 [Gammaproteobacteria bacterium]|nr:hypothetical protein [Gammaproteobacteria bacterium]